MILKLEQKEGLRVIASLVAEKLRKLISKEESKNQALVVLSSGQYDTGKKQVAEVLAKRFANEGVVVIHHNDYLHQRQQQRLAEDPSSIDWQRLVNDLGKLKAGQSILKPRYDQENQRLSGQEEVFGRVVVVWGVFALHNSLLDLSDLRIYCESDKFTRMLRYFLGELNNFSPNEIADSWLTAQETTKHRIEPTKIRADFILTNDKQPSFSGKKARKLVDHWRWPVALTKSSLSVLGKVKIGDTRYQEESFIFSTCRRQIVRLRRDSIAFLSKDSHGVGEVWYELKLSQEMAKRLKDFYRSESLDVGRIRTIYEVVGRPFRFYVDKRAIISCGDYGKEVGNFSGLIHRHRASNCETDLEEVVQALKLEKQVPAKAYYQMSI
jgi:uridine kinase